MQLDTVFEELGLTSRTIQLEYMWALAETADVITDKDLEELQSLEHRQQEFVQDLGDLLEESSDIETLRSKTTRKIGEYGEENSEKAQEFEQFMTEKCVGVYQQLEIPEYEKVLGQIENIDNSEADEFFNHLEAQLQQLTPSSLDADYESIKDLTETALRSAETTEQFAESVRGFHQSFEYADKNEKIEEFIEKLYVRALPIEPEYFD